MPHSVIVTQLQHVYDTFTPQTWIKGAMFENKFNKEGVLELCMCIHGAVQNEINLKVRDAEINNKRIFTSAAIGTCANAALDARKLMQSYPNKSMQELWDLNKSKYDHIKQVHFILGMVGLTTGFNDTKTTTFEMVQAKLLEAIELAKTLN